MTQITRIILYESDDDERLKNQLAKSLSEGIHHLAVKITIMDLSDYPYTEVMVKDLLKDVTKK